MTHETPNGFADQPRSEGSRSFRFSSGGDVDERAFQRTRRQRPGKWIVLAVILIAAIAGFVASQNRQRSPQTAASAQRDAPQRRRQPHEASQLEQRQFAIQLHQARTALKNGDATQAEADLRALLAASPDNGEANKLMCVTLRCSGRNWEARPYVLALLRHGVVRVTDLITLTSAKLELGPEEEAIIRKAQGHNEVLSRLSEAQYLLDHNLYEKALPFLQGVVADDPNQLQAQARLGSVLLTMQRTAEFQRWQRALPEHAFTHPEIWMVRGLDAENHNEKQAAAFCYWQVLQRHPDHPSATYRLSQQLQMLGRESDAAMLAKRAKQLATLETAILEARAHKEKIANVVRRMESLGRLWEAWGWSHVALQRGGQENLGWARDRIAELRQQLTPETPLVVDDQNTSKQIDLSAWSLPPWKRRSDVSDEVVASAASGPIAFVDSANEAGISFSYFNGADPQRAYMFEFSGGGVAVLDYDGDGWPDIYLTQGCPWPVELQTKYSDRLYRNLGNGQFIDVTEQAGLQATGYGQGATTGDFNSDGLPDLYIANIGPNQLYRNNGDGTFTDVSTALHGAKWTISTLLADLDGDSLPDVYDVNYLTGDKVFTEVCYKYGGPVQCYPTQFPADTDAVYRNAGNGTFDDVSNEAGIAIPNGKGMGIVAADFDGSRKLSLFIANDTTENFLFHNESHSGVIQFAEQGLLSGVALNQTGLAASCMGVAAGDISGDGRLDLFVTNFQVEPNNLYVQVDNLQFEDQIQRSRLHDPGFLLEGWGAQFLDGDLDGRLDLVVANGHLHNYPHSPNQNLMPTQFFRNTGDARFAEVPASQLGAYFAQKRLARAIARLDWNRDGRPDFCVTHVHAAFALLTNRTQDAGHYLSVRLRGVESSRDALGATVIVEAGERTFSQQLTAGDGFAASNQRQLIFGLGDRTAIDQLTIHWPAGLDQTFSNVAADQELLLVEGQPRPYPLAR